MQDKHSTFGPCGGTIKPAGRDQLGDFAPKFAQLNDDVLFGANVTFEPGCRNNWHIHHADQGGGQILLCTDGRGWYQEWGKPAQPLQPGDAVSIPAGVKHWHGAAKDSWFSHVAIEVPGQNCHTEWCEPVSAEDYALLP